MRDYSDLAARLAQYSERGPGGCLLWIGRKTRGGYGLMMVRGKRHVAHRVAWHVATGDRLDMPEIVRHFECRTPACIEPSHLRKGSYADNSADMVRDGTSRRGEKASTAKLTREDVREIRRLRAEGWTQPRLCERFGVAQTTMSDITRRRSWAWLDDLA